MIIDSRKLNGPRGVLVDSTTNQRIPGAFRANLATGEYSAYVLDQGGKPVRPVRIVHGRANLRFVEGRAPKLRVPASVDAKAAAEELADIRRITSKKLLIPGDYCDARGCHKLSEWSVATEQMLSPTLGPNGTLQERSAVIDLSNFCSRHYRLPVSKSTRGIESEVQVLLARPQW